MMMSLITLRRATRVTRSSLTLKCLVSSSQARPVWGHLWFQVKKALTLLKLHNHQLTAELLTKSNNSSSRYNLINKLNNTSISLKTFTVARKIRSRLHQRRSSVQGCLWKMMTTKTQGKKREEEVAISRKRKASKTHSKRQLP